MPFTPIADAELLVRGFLVAQFSPTRVVVETPSNLSDVVPLIQVARFGGSSTFYGLDDANIDVDYFDGAHDNKSARENAQAGSGLVRSALLLHLPGYSSGGAAVQSVTEISAPRWVPYDNTSLRRITAAYRITIRSIPS